MKRRIGILVLALMLILSLNVFAEKADRYEQVFDASQDAGKLTARFLQLTTRSDDKSGDCTILTSPDGKVMVIDAGNPSTFVDVDNALKALGITRIDYLVASHPHVDHIGSFAQLIYAYEIGAVYTSEIEYPTSHYRRYMEAIESTNTPTSFWRRATASSLAAMFWWKYCIRLRALNTSKAIPMAALSLSTTVLW